MPGTKFNSITSTVMRTRLFTLRSIGMEVGLLTVLALSGCAVGPLRG